MVTVCAWCQKFLGVKDPQESIAVTHGICATCAAREQLSESATLVISRRRADTLAIFEDLFRAVPEVRVVLDRRLSDRRRVRPVIDVPGGRRMRRDRRQNVAMILV